MTKKSVLTNTEDLPQLDYRRKIILVVSSFFLLVSFLAQTPAVAIISEKLTKMIPSKITSKYDGEDYKEVGIIGKMRVAKIKEYKESYWKKFGNWDSKSVDCWLIIGAIIICLLAKKSIVKSFVKAIQKVIPLTLIYILSDVPANIMQKSGISEKLVEAILPTTVSRSFKYKALFFVFGFCLLANFFVTSVALSAGLVEIFAPVLLSISESTLIYAAIFAWIGTILGMAFSPFNGILQASLKKTRTTYKLFIKKVWPLMLTMILTSFVFTTLWTRFMIEG